MRLEPADIDAFIFVVFIVVIVLFVFLLISYILDSIMKMKIFKLFGTCSPVLAWVPYLSSYMLGRMCNGKSGENLGIFGMRVPNWLWNVGWLFPTFCYVAGLTLSNLVPSLTVVFSMLTYASQAFTFIYWASVYSFLFSRMEGKYENEVRVLAIVSVFIPLVALIKILATPAKNVYSLENDLFPEDTRHSDPWNNWGSPPPSGGYYGGSQAW